MIDLRKNPLTPSQLDDLSAELGFDYGITAYAVISSDTLAVQGKTNPPLLVALTNLNPIEFITKEFAPDSGVNLTELAVVNATARLDAGDRKEVIWAPISDEVATLIEETIVTGGLILPVLKTHFEERLCDLITREEGFWLCANIGEKTSYYVSTSEPQPELLRGWDDFPGLVDPGPEFDRETAPGFYAVGIDLN